MTDHQVTYTLFCASPGEGMLATFGDGSTRYVYKQPDIYAQTEKLQKEGIVGLEYDNV